MPNNSNPGIGDGESPPGAGKPGDGPPDVGPRPAARLVTLLIIVAVLGAGAYRLGPLGRTSAPAIPAKAPSLIHAQQRVTVPEGSPVRASLAIETVEDQDIQQNLVLPAVVEVDPARLVKVLPPLSGRVTQLMIQLGQRVEAGQPLLVLDSPDLATAYADYERAKGMLVLTTRNRDRQRGLASVGGAAQKDREQAESDYIGAEAESRRTEARLKEIGVDADTSNKSRTVTLVAPISGSVTDLSVAPGAIWNDPTAAMMTVSDLSTVWVTAGVPEKDSSLVSKGQPVEVTFVAYPGEVFTGRVLFVSDVLDPDTRRTKVRIAFKNTDTRLKPGMFATASFFAPARRVPAVPTSALALRGDATQVFVEVAPWTFEARSIDIEFQQAGRAIIKSGVKAGDRIVVKGGVLLGD